MNTGRQRCAWRSQLLRCEGVQIRPPVVAAPHQTEPLGSFAVSRQPALPKLAKCTLVSKVGGAKRHMCVPCSQITILVWETGTCSRIAVELMNMAALFKFVT
jgi:hypothetical protein